MATAADEDERVTAALEGKVSVYLADKRTTEAVQLYEDYLASHPDTNLRGVLTYGLGALHEQMGDRAGRDRYYARSIEAFRKEIDEALESTQKAGLILQQGLVYRAMGDAEAAHANWARVAEEFPQSENAVHAMEFLAQSLFESGKTDEAASWAERIISRYGGTESAQRAAVFLQRVQMAKASGADGATTAPRGTQALPPLP
jgi:TolA-binding protein